MNDIKDYLRNFKGSKILMAIYPHPDDETIGAGGLLLEAKKLGYRTIVVTLTKGAEGGINVGFGGEKLKRIREKELQKAVKHLKVDELVHGDFDDGLMRQRQIKWEKWLEKKIEELSPGIVVTYDHSGMYGHPDHIVLSLVVKKILERAKLKTVPVLLWTSFAETVKKKLVKDSVWDFASDPHLYLDLGIETFAKWQAMKAHKSQKMGKNLPIPLFIVSLIFRREWYHQAELNKIYPHKFIELDYITEILNREKDK